jgi:hypothetical protein
MTAGEQFPAVFLCAKQVGITAHADVFQQPAAWGFVSPVRDFAFGAGRIIRTFISQSRRSGLQALKKRCW